MLQCTYKQVEIDSLSRKTCWGITSIAIQEILWRETWSFVPDMQLDFFKKENGCLRAIVPTILQKLFNYYSVVCSLIFSVDSWNPFCLISRWLDGETSGKLQNRCILGPRIQSLLCRKCERTWIRQYTHLRFLQQISNFKSHFQLQKVMHHITILWHLQFVWSDLMGW